MAQSNDVNRNQSQDIYIQRLSHFGPSLGKMPLGFMSFCYGKDHNFGLRQIDIKARGSATLLKLA